MTKTRDEILELALELTQNDENEGICIACGEVQDGVEPDAHGYKCEACGAHKVYGAEEVLLMLGN